MTTAHFRAVTDGALARSFAHDVDGRASARRVTVPWDRFDGARYPDAALEIAYDAMRSLASGEYAAVEGFSRLCAGFSWHGVPYDLIAACARIPADELRHSELALRAASRLSGREPGAIPLSLERRRPARPPDVRMPLNELDVHVALLPAMLETLAAAFLTEARRRATDPMLRAVYSSVLSDEIHHARLGWYYLAWRAPQWTRAEQQRVADVVGHELSRRTATISDGRDPPRGCVRALRALGVMTRAEQDAVVRRALEDEVVPAFDALGLGASRAYAQNPLARAR